MSDREKLIELLDTGLDKIRCGVLHFNLEILADHLISNGITVQKWIPVSERLPEFYRNVLILENNGSHFGVTIGWYSERFRQWNNAFERGLPVTHWMPLPEPPKECE